MTDTFQSIIKSFSKPSILVIGDVMLDIYVYGKTERISPEAPIPILNVSSEKEMLGGAGNVISNINSLGCKGDLIGIVGNDEGGRKVNNLVNKLSLSENDIFTCSSFQTIIKTRFVSGSQQIMRSDQESLFDMPLDLEDRIIECALTKIDKNDAVIVSDYGKGLLSERICRIVIETAHRIGKPIFVDPKGNNYSKYTYATLIKPNLNELKEYFPSDRVDLKKEYYAKKILTDYSIDFCLLTLGGEGMLLINKDEIIQLNASTRKVYDVSGAGDSVIATLAVSCCAGANIREASFLSNLAGGIVVSKPGTSLVTQGEILSKLNEPVKIVCMDELMSRINKWKTEGHRIGFTDGCFELLHVGHIQTITYAKKYCDKLIVALNSDRSITGLKRKGRPIICEGERSMILSALENVDTIIFFEDEGLRDLIGSVLPDVLIKGWDNKKEEVVGFDIVESYGGKVVLTPYWPDRSTTKIISKIRESKFQDNL